MSDPTFPAKSSTCLDHESSSLERHGNQIDHKDLSSPELARQARLVPTLASGPLRKKSNDARHGLAWPLGPGRRQGMFKTRWTWAVHKESRFFGSAAEHFSAIEESVSRVSGGPLARHEIDEV